MKNFKTKIYAVICIIPMLIAVFSIGANAAYVGSSYISSQGACVMDYDTGEVYYSYNGDTARIPASMTKIMTIYCVYEAMASGAFDINTPVPISRNVYNKSRNPEYQTVPLYYDTLYTVDEMIGMVMTWSDIGSTVALAELVSGSEWEFVQLMNQKASELDINAYFYDCFGVANNRISPIALATLVRNFVSKYPDIIARSSKRSVYFHGRTYSSTNHLYDTHYYQGADGFKTGTTSAAGYCFTATAKRDGRRMIAVTMCSSSSGQRFTDATHLLNYGFGIAAAKYSTIYFTDAVVTLNGVEIPTFAYDGKLAVIAESLANYGFDVTYSDDERTLTVAYNSEKAVTPLEVSGYKNKEGIGAFSVLPTDIKVIFVKDGVPHTLANAYNVDGNMCILTDDLINIYNGTWDQTTRSAHLIVA